MQLVFSHGMESGPWGFKIKRLSGIAEARGYEVLSVDYRDTMDPDERVDRLLTRLQGGSTELVLAGSSMGGYVSLVASASVTVAAVFLMAPALYIPGWKRQQYPSRAPHIEIVHGWADTVIPAQNSIDFARTAECELHLIRGDHALNTSIASVEAIFCGFLDRVAASAAT
jgi:pimeloyl-ACP methyl ester carboxylesterase